VEKLESGVSVNSEDNPCAEDEFGILKTSCVNGGRFRPEENKVIPTAEISRAIINPTADSILISRMNTLDLVGESAYVDRDYPNLFLPDRLWKTAARTETDTSAKWLSFVVQSLKFRAAVSNAATGTSGSMKNISQKSYLAIGIYAPPTSEQRQIAEILSTLEEEIEQTQALVEKWRQIKAGLMHDLFNRGITPDGHLRRAYPKAPHLYQNSPVGWIPHEWSIKPLGAMAEIVSGVTLGSKLQISDCVEAPYLRVANVQDGYFDLTEIKTVSVSRAQFEKLQLRLGDVLMNEGGDFDKLGRGSVWEEAIKPCIHQNHVFRVRPVAHVIRSYYLAFWSQSEAGKHYFRLNSKQSTNLASINSTQLNRFPVALPPIAEQERIETRIVALRARIEAESTHLAKLRQQKQGLMHDLLTGQVRVPTSEGAFTP
jgi:type I restriction enzyme S subunit